MITEEQFKNYIGQLSDKYEELKDLIVVSDLPTFGKQANDLLGAVSEFRDIACTALRESHTNKNFKSN